MVVLMLVRGVTVCSLNAFRTLFEVLKAESESESESESAGLNLM
jgi:hypothetical protein